MFQDIKKRIDRKLRCYLKNADKLYSLSTISPLLSKNIKEFTLREGKRLRPVLFITSYLGFAKKAAPGLYTSAISLELLHDFMLVHDDIIDKSETRRGKPSMHTLLNKQLSRYKNIKFNGEDLAIVAGDLMYALSIQAFLSIQEEPQRKEKALKKFIEATIYTASGEFMEILYGLNSIEKISKEDIYKIYDLKTACYTFATPLAMGAILAGASDKQTAKLFQYGIYLGRAFQIKDDILGLFGDEKKTGKSTMTDLEEGKKTVLIWHAYAQAKRLDKLRIKNILSKNRLNKPDLLQIRRILCSYGTPTFAKKEISILIKKADHSLASIQMLPRYKKFLDVYSKEIIDLYENKLS